MVHRPNGADRDAKPAVRHRPVHVTEKQVADLGTMWRNGVAKLARLFQPDLVQRGNVNLEGRVVHKQEHVAIRRRQRLRQPGATVGGIVPRMRAREDGVQKDEPSRRCIAH